MAILPRSALLLSALLSGLMLSNSAKADSRFPLKIGPTGRYLVDRNGKPFLIAGESPQAMMVNVSEKDAELFFKNRRSHGFNTAWINLICAKYTGGRDDASTFDGLRPFKTREDFSQPNEEYFARCDRIIRLAAKYDTLVMLDPAETGSFLAVMQKNGVDKCRAYGRYLGKRYKDFDNLLWFHGNDYAQDTPENDKLVTAIAQGIKDEDDRHLHTIEIDWKSKGVTSLDNERWAPLVGLSAAYNYKPVQVPILRDYNRKTDHRVPTFMVESSYEFENVAGIKFGDPHQLRLQEYTSNLCGTTGQLYGNKYTWPFLDGWQQQLDTPGAVQMKYVQALFEPRRWDDLVPDQQHKLVTAGFGKLDDFDYAAAARTPDGRLAMVYIPDKRTINVDMSQLASPAIARWYDPASGKFHEIAGSPLANNGTHQFATPGDNADGPGNADWVLALETVTPK
jgi:Protein of unknown function (DUF4038)/Putative collagen-binding domain of a collagenase